MVAIGYWLNGEERLEGQLYIADATFRRHNPVRRGVSDWFISFAPLFRVVCVCVCVRARARVCRLYMVRGNV